MFYHTSEHDRDAPRRSVSTTVTLAEATNDTMVLVKAATSGVRRVWCGGHRYSKARLVTVDLVPLADSQRALPGMDLGDRAMSANLMAALDTCNRRFGRGTVVTGAAGFPSKGGWSTKFEMRSPRYTTRLDELPGDPGGIGAAGTPCDRMTASPPPSFQTDEMDREVGASRTGGLR